MCVSALFIPKVICATHGCIGNLNPTFKPVDLNRWLASMLLPPASVQPRRLLVPFAGVGSEMIG